MSHRSYEVRVRGPVPEGVLHDLLDEFPSVELSTVLSGMVRDQSELHGLLQQMFDLGIEVIAFRRIPEEVPADRSPLPMARNGT